MERRASTRPSAAAKRTRRVEDSEESEEEVSARGAQPRRNARASTSKNTSPAKRQRVVPVPSPSQLNDSDLEILTDDEGGEARAGTSGTKDRQAGSLEGHVNRNGANGDAEEEELDDDDGGDGADGRTSQTIGQRPEYERGDDRYVAGSITGIKMIDFMTYDHVEFRPGPHLNMILGPNGTGKSTIAAGIAIGLGFSPKVMGRANDLRAYVKQGREEGTVEVELKGRRGKRNPVIWRKFNREDKSEWKLNGQTCTAKAVRELVVGMGIQANNLCAFLAQDRVAEFSKMTPSYTLKETMRAAGDPRLSTWHETLIAKGEEKKGLDEKLETGAAKREQLQAQVDNLAPDVRSFEARENQEFERAVLEMTVKATEYQVRQAEWQKSQKVKKAVQKRNRAMAERRKPLDELLDYWTRKSSKAKVLVKDNENTIRDRFSNIKSAHSKIRDKLEDFEACETQFDGLRRRITRREQRIAEHKRQLRDVDELLSQPQDHVERMREKNKARLDAVNRVREAANESERLVAEYKDGESQLQKILEGIDASMRRQNQLSNIEIQREQKARQVDPSIGYALDWLKIHATELEAPVCRPAIVSLNVRDQRYAWQIEACLSRAHRNTFICQSRKDFDRMLTLNGTKVPSGRDKDGNQTREFKVALDLVYLEVTEANLNPQRSCSAEELQRLGFDGVAIDFVVADQAMIAFLNQHCNFHLAALTQRDGRELDTAAIARKGFWMWCSKNETIRSNQSRYGSKAFQMSSQYANPAWYLNLSVDQQAVTRIAEEVADLKRKREEREKPHSALRVKRDKAREHVDVLNREKQSIEKEMQKIRDEGQKLNKARMERDRLTKLLEQAEAEPSYDEERSRLKAEKLRKAIACYDPLKTIKPAFEAVLDSSRTAASCDLVALECDTNRGVISVHAQKRDQEIQEGEDALQQITDQVNEIKAKCKALSDEVAEMARNAPAGVSAAMQARVEAYGAAPGPAQLDNLRNELERVIADLELSVGINPAIIARHKRLSEELAGVQSSVGSLEKKINKLRDEINSVLAKFDPALDKLVAVISDRFSEAFERVGNSGFVHLIRDERGYEYWGLDTKCAFREGEALESLTGSRQSGGERSLATVTYLMSLTEMARTPFSLVDEINQGMDQVAERNMHNQLVEVTCGKNAGQYFLITPKLLTGLKYHRKMKVLIVNNGHWLPDGTDPGQKFGDLKSCVKKYKQTHAIAAR